MQWIFTYSMPSQLLNQCWITVNQTTENIFQWNMNEKTNIFCDKNALENVFKTEASLLVMFLTPPYIHMLYSHVILSYIYVYSVISVILKNKHMIL